MSDLGDEVRRRGSIARRAAMVLLVVGALGVAGCQSDDSAGLSDERGENNVPGNNGMGPGGMHDAGWGSNNAPEPGGDYVPEQEEEFEFSAPAVVGGRVYVANETLNSVAVIDSRNLAIGTRLVGFRPTEVVGPDARRAVPSADARVMVLNQGSHSVSILRGDDELGSDAPVASVKVMAHANRIAMDPTGVSAVVWYDPARREAGEAAGDLSSVSVVRGGKAYQVAVGFHVRQVAFDDAGSRALVLSDDGVSLIEFDALGEDGIAMPTPVVGGAEETLQPADLEVLFTRDGRWALARSADVRGVSLLEVDAGTLHFLPLSETPTDIDLIEGDELEVLMMLRQSSRAIRATIPEGFIAAAQALAAGGPPGWVPLGLDEQDAGGWDVDAQSDAGMDAGDDVGPGYDTGYDGGYVSDVGFDAGNDGGNGNDVGYDVGNGGGNAQDVGMDARGDAGDAGDAMDAATGGDAISNGPGEPVGDIAGFAQIDLIIGGLGAAVVSSDGSQALLYTTLNEETRAILYDLRAAPGAPGAQRALRFEKGLRGALSDDAGRAFLVFHTRVPGAIPQGATPADPAYIAHSWGVSVVDVASGALRLVLSKHEPGQAVLTPSEDDAAGDAAGDVAGEPLQAMVYMIFKAPAASAQVEPTQRDVLSVNLETFRTDYFRVPSVPEGLGLIPQVGRVYISQRHPQGRMTFVDLRTGKRQTLTGYQLNAGIR